MNELTYPDVQRGDFAIPTANCVDWLTAGKKYEILERDEMYFMIKDESGEENWCKPVNSTYLNGGSWRFAKAEQKDS
jgi:hypothetical protein